MRKFLLATALTAAALSMGTAAVAQTNSPSTPRGTLGQVGGKGDTTASEAARKARSARKARRCRASSADVQSETSGGLADCRTNVETGYPQQ